MNLNEFEAWLSRNVKNVGKGGAIPPIDPFNRAKIGSERNERPEEFPMKDVEEYPRYNEWYTPYSEDDEDDQRQNDSSDSRSQSFESQSRSTSYSRSKAQKASKNAGKATKNVAKNLVSKVVLVVVGSIIVVSGYNAVQAHEAAKAAPPPVASVEWKWDEDYSSVTAELLDAQGATIEKVPATVVSEEVAATCSAEGKITYTATYTGDDGKEYTDVKTVTRAAVGHAFEKVGEEEDGDTVTTTFECTHCHERFTVITSVEEEDY